mmetsp:Transcript_4376/g.7758  ORF Transcript_4376/g.7758 Transcript_4376/m.7758 type:complete len:432 (+) Transcript_4376:82-1377(+)|eukprot:CAMPEP_0197682234 /NCGR_PEP_ID=MMETSP1338-20131121/96174_1 /TAXON_ID=43686 ORGANISM="Pelagodinium beii, Strain RCC1491" /NCGR_SAMPLE_ID=MMETSP1338 /ASSEMBLY_ACC=CAM_ASM_000754 /LENGTH=431 /DNA_ID=CAMNT_0043263675 /DNA_START=9 /DNA_END=1304 /DNA_ORIENTATION=-
MTTAEAIRLPESAEPKIFGARSRDSDNENLEDADLEGGASTQVTHTPSQSISLDAEDTAGDEAEAQAEVLATSEASSSSSAPPPGVAAQAPPERETATEENDQAAPQEAPAAQPGPSDDAQQRQEIVAQVCRQWLLLFVLISFILGVLSIAMFLWLVFVWVKVHLRVNFGRCDKNLTLWVHVLYAVMVFNFVKSTSSGQKMLHCVCRWEQDPEIPRPAPLRIKIFNLLIPCFMLGWNSIGIYWAKKTATFRSEVEACRTESEGVLNAIFAFAITNIVVTVFMILNIVALAYLLRQLMRMGGVQPNKAAPAGSLEENTEKATAEEACKADCPQCAICLEDFDAEEAEKDEEKATGDIEIVRTKTCNHYFHKDCIKDWLGVNSVCPLCRTSLAKGDSARDPATPSSPGDGQEGSSPTLARTFETDETVVEETV